MIRDGTAVEINSNQMRRTELRLDPIIQQLRQERAQIASQLDKLDAALDALTGEGPSVRKRVKQIKNSSITAPVVAKKRTMSAATRAKISRAQKAHWAAKAKK